MAEASKTPDGDALLSRVIINMTEYYTNTGMGNNVTWVAAKWHICRLWCVVVMKQQI